MAAADDKKKKQKTESLDDAVKQLGLSKRAIHEVVRVATARAACERASPACDQGGKHRVAALSVAAQQRSQHNELFDALSSGPLKRRQRQNQGAPRRVNLVCNRANKCSRAAPKRRHSGLFLEGKIHDQSTPGVRSRQPFHVRQHAMSMQWK